METSLVGPERVELETLTTGLSPKQREAILYAAMGMSDREVRVYTGVVYNTIKDWRRNDKFMSVFNYVRDNVSMEQSREAMRLFLGSYHPLVLQQIVEMAVKPWDELRSQAEIGAKLKCIEMINKCLGMDTPVDKKAPTQTWNQIIMNIQKEDVYAGGDKY